MDEMKLSLNTKFMKGIVTKLLRKVIISKIGVKANIDLNDLNISYKDGKVYFHLDVNGDMTQEEFMKLIQKYV